MKWKKCILSFSVVGMIACVSPLQALAASSSEIENQIASYMADLEASQEKSDDLEQEISVRQEEVGALYADVASLNIEKESYKEDMKTRIAYFYEEMQTKSILSVLFGSHNFAEFISRIQFQQSIYDYDAARMDEYQELVDELKEKEEQLDTEIEDLGDMVEEQAVLQATLSATISDKNDELEEVKKKEAEEAAAKAAAEAAAKEAQKRAEEDALAYALSASAETTAVKETAAEESAAKETASEKTAAASESAETKASEPAEKTQTSAATSSQSTSSPSGYSMPSGDGVLTKSKGINYYNGHKETWYTQRILPGEGLNIPGRHLDERGIVCDGDGYICVASSDYPKGTIVETSLGTAKVYDCGCASGIIDIYTDW